jgi:hypothetical protein
VNPRPAYVSVIDPISPAIERVRTILFRPFDLGKWFVIGFTAWLAQFGSSRGGSGGAGAGPHRPNNPSPEVREEFDRARDYVLANLDWILPVAIFVVLFIVTLVLLFKWLSSRGHFMFLHCVAQNKAEVITPWHQFERHGNSLFLFRIVVGTFGFLTAVLFVGLGVMVAVTARKTVGFTPFSILGIVMCGLLTFASAIVFGGILKLTLDFVVPIMYLRSLRCTQAWQVLLEVLADNKGRVVLYLLFHIVINMAIGLLVLGVTCVTCCIACCFFLTPYIGTVAALPLIMFKRSYSLCYLAQYGPEFNVFPREPEAVAPSPGFQP